MRCVTVPAGRGLGLIQLIDSLGGQQHASTDACHMIAEYLAASVVAR